jgi:peptide/nickel transport system substrate-binding protein
MVRFRFLSLQSNKKDKEYDSYRENGVRKCCKLFIKRRDAMKTFLSNRRALGLLVVTVLVSCFIGVPGAMAEKEKILVIAEGVGPQSLDPHRSTVQAVLNISMAICEPLALLDYSTMEIKPNLALSWQPLNDTTWEIKLREGVRFTNGEPFNAESVKYTVERIKKPELKSPTKISVRAIKKVKIVDAATVHLITDGPAPTIPFHITRFGIVPPKHVEKAGLVEFGKNPVGTGPFMVSKWVKDEYVELKANPDYWKGRAKLDRVVYKSIPETLTRMAALKNGEADMVSGVMIEEIPAIEKKKGFKVVEMPSLRTMFIQFNMTKDSPIMDKRVRQAMNYAVDVDSIIKNILGGYGNKLNGQVLSKEYQGYNPNLKPYPYDPAKAKELMKAAGFENYEFSLMASQGRYLRGKEVAEVVGHQLNAAGIKNKVQIMEWGGFLTKMLAKELFHMGMWGAATVPVADLYLGAMVREGGAYSVYVNPEYNKVFDQAAITIDEAKAKELWNKAAEICYDDPPFIFLYQQMSIYGLNERVGGWTPQPDDWIDLYSMYAKQQ